MNRLKKIAQNVVVIAGMSMMAIPSFAQQDSCPDQFLAASEMSQPVAQQQKEKGKVQLASSKRPKTRRHRVAKSDKSKKQLIASARK